MKIIKLLAISFCLFIANMIVYAQECYTPSTAPPAWLFNPSLRSTSNIPSSYTVRVFFHIVRSSGGNGLGSNIISTMISKLNSDFLSSGIQFQSDGFDFIDNDAFYNIITQFQYESLCSVNSHTNAIDVYILGTTTMGMTSGVAPFGIPSTSFIVHGNRYNTTTLSHEMGHCLGLYHTHHGTVNELGGDDQQCTELVNGSNAATCGDYISDTPADPNLWIGCNYSGGNLVDANNQFYVPDSKNYMAYSEHTCRNMFTTLQKERMRDFIANTPILQNVIVHAISGNDLVPCSGNVLFYVPAPSVSWSVSSNLQIIIGSGTHTITVSKASSGTSQSGTINATYTMGGVTYNLSKNVAVGARYITSLNASSYNVYPGATISFEASPNFSSSEGDYEWIVSPSSGVIQSAWRHTNVITFPTSGPYTVGVRSTASCITPGTYTTVQLGSRLPSFISSVRVSGKLVDVSFDPGFFVAKQLVIWRLLYLMTGIPVASGQIYSSGGTLDFNYLPAGIYLLQIDLGNGTIETHKIVLI